MSFCLARDARADGSTSEGLSEIEKGGIMGDPGVEGEAEEDLEDAGVESPESGLSATGKARIPLGARLTKWFPSKCSYSA